MKQVLLIDDSPVFRDYLRGKLTSRHIETEIGVGILDCISKTRSLLPDLIIIDFNTARQFIFDLLESKKTDPNAHDIPVIVLAQKMDKQELARLSAFPIKKILPKPIKIDQLFELVSSTLKIEFDIDTTPCILEARVNDNVIFVEIAQGLNREKIELLKFRIRELIDLYSLSFPKILIMMTDVSLSFVDGSNLELLLSSILADASIKNRNVKFLTFDGFTKEFIEGNPEYADIEIVRDLSKAIDSLIKDVDKDEDASTVISERILSGGQNSREGSLEMRFKSELETLKAVAQDIRIAIVDDDVVIRTVLYKTLQAIHADIHQFESGDAFLPKGLSSAYDLIFLDLMMPGMNGFEVIRKMKEAEIDTPIIVLSAISQREAVLKVLQAGVKSYMIKPLKPEAIIKKSIEVLQAAI